MSKTRLAIGGLALSAAAFVGILTRESYTDEAIIPTKGDVPTLGFGTTSGVKMGDKTTPVKAAQRALLDVSKYEGAIKRCVTAPLSQAEYDVYVALSYNVGPTNFCTNRKTGQPSNLVKNLNAQDYAAACYSILEYKYAAGYDCSTMIDGKPNKRCYGVWIDREKSHKKCLDAQ